MELFMKCFYDLHIHSALSPCAEDDMTPNNIINMAQLKGLDMIAVSDHNSIGNLEAVMECAKGKPIVVIPAMEVETAEEVHVLTFFKDIKTAAQAEAFIKKNRSKIKNRPEIFGQQLLLDSKDNIRGREDDLLMVASSISIGKLKIEVERLGGIFIPAHIDRSSNSVLSNLGILPEIGIQCMEVSRRGTFEEYEHLGKMLISNSDAHYLEDISEKVFSLDLPEISFDGLDYYIKS